MHSIHTSAAPQPAGHYSQAMVHGGLVYVAGQLPIVPGQTTHAPGPFEQQAEQVLRNVEAILRAADSGLDQLLSVTVYITDIAHWPAFNAVYARVLGEHRPARAVVPVPTLHHGYALEITAIAAVVSGVTADATGG